MQYLRLLVIFQEPVLVEVTRVIGWVLIINALAIIPRTILLGM